jgi:hypothetical protein
VDTDLLAERIDRLERRCRRWRLAGVIFAVMIGIPILAVLIGLITNDGIREANGLLIRDANDKVRMDLGTSSDGNPRMLLVGANGEPQMEIGLRNGASTVQLLGGDKAGMLMLADDNALNFSLKDKGGTSRLMMTLGANGDPSVSLHDSKGELRAQLFDDSDGSLRLQMRDSGMRIRIGLGVNKDGLPTIGFLDTEGKIRFEIHLDEHGNPRSFAPQNPADPGAEKPARGSPVVDPRRL